MATVTRQRNLNPYGLVFDPGGAPGDQYVSPEELAMREALRAEAGADPFRETIRGAFANVPSRTLAPDLGPATQLTPTAAWLPGVSQPGEAPGGALAPKPVGPNGRTYDQITGTDYLSAEERAWYHAQEGRVIGDDDQPYRPELTPEAVQMFAAGRNLLAGFQPQGWLTRAMEDIAGQQEAERPPSRVPVHTTAQGVPLARKPEPSALDRIRGFLDKSPSAPFVGVGKPVWERPASDYLGPEIPASIRGPMKSVVAPVARAAVDVLAPWLEASRLLGIQPIGSEKAGEAVAEAVVWRYAGEILLEFVPTIGTVPDAIRAARALGPKFAEGLAVAARSGRVAAQAYVRNALESGPAIARGADVVPPTAAMRTVAERQAVIAGGAMADAGPDVAAMVRALNSQGAKLQMRKTTGALAEDGPFLLTGTDVLGRRVKIVGNGDSFLRERSFLAGGPHPVPGGTTTLAGRAPPRPPGPPAGAETVAGRAGRHVTVAGKQMRLNDDGTVTLFHGTTKDRATEIGRTGNLKAEAEPDVYLTTDPGGGGYGDGTVVRVRVDPKRLQLDDEFPGGRRDFRISVGRPGGTLSVQLDEVVAAARPAIGAAAEAGITPPRGPASPAAPPPRGPGAGKTAAGGAGMDAVRIKFLTAAKQEENLRRVGTVGREIRQGRAAQFTGVGEVIRTPGLTLAEAGQRAREAAYQGGTLRKTFLQPIVLTDAEKASVLEDLTGMAMREEITAPDYLRMVLPGDSRTPGIVAKLQSDRPKLMPNEIALVRKVFGDEFANAAAARSAKSLEPLMTKAQERAAMESAARIEEKGVVAAQREAQQAATKANQLEVRARETKDAADIRAAQQARARATKAADQADVLERSQADRAEQAQIARSVREAELESQRATNLARRAQETRDAADFRAAALARDRASRAFDRADELEMRQVQRYNEEALARQEKAGAPAEQKANELRRRGQEKLDTKDPNYEQIYRKAEQLATAEGPAGGGTPHAAALIKYNLEGNRYILDRMSEPGARDRIAAAVRGFLNGDLKDAFVATTVRRTENLRHALVADGMDPILADKVSDLIRDMEIRKRYQGAIPEGVTKALAEMKGAPYGDTWAGVDKFIQRWKNQVFSSDMGIFGIQGKAAIDRGGMNGMAGLVNRTLNLLHLPHADLYMAETGLPNKLRNIADGAHFGLGPSAVNARQGTLMSYAFERLGKPGAILDAKIEQAMDWANRMQFGTILGFGRELAIEGNLTIFKVLGRNIDNPATRAAAMDTANGITSFANAALNSGRAGWERKLLTSVPMARSEIANILQMSKLIRPTASVDERILASTLIFNRVASVMIVGAGLNEIIGVGEFQMNPLKPGFGQITTKWKDKNGKNIVVSTIPQVSIAKALVQSMNELALHQDPEAAGAALARGLVGRSSIVGQIGAATLGIGYDSQGKFHLGDLFEGKNVGQRVLGIGQRALVPPLGQQLAQTGTEPGYLAGQALGVNTFPESEYRTLSRQFKDITGQDWTKLPPSESWLYVEQHPELEQAYKDWQQSREGTAARIAADKATGLEAIAPLFKTDPGAYRKQAGDIAGRAAIQYELAKREGLIPDYSKEGEGWQKALDGYYTEIAKATDPKTMVTDWEKQDRLERDYLATLTPEVREVVLKELTFSRDPTYRELKEANARLGTYFDLRDKAWADISRGDKELEKYTSLDAWRLDLVNEYVAAGLSRTEAKKKAAEYLSKITDKVAKELTAYLADHPGLIRDLDRLDYFIPARLEKYARPGAIE